MPSLPNVGGDLNIWGDELNAFLLVSLNPNGTLRAAAVLAALNPAPLAQSGQVPAQEPVRAQGVESVGSLDVAARADHVHPSSRLITAQSGTSYTLLLADAGTFIEFTNASAVTVTIPPNSSVAFPVGSWVELLQYGAGQITVSPGSGVTRRSNGGKSKTAAQYAVARLTKIATDEWVLSGDIST